MKVPRPSLAPLLRSDLQGELLAELFLHPERELTLTDLARLLEAPLTTVHAEIGRLADAGLVAQRRIGRARLVRAEPEHPLTPALTKLLTLTYGPTAVLPGLLTKVRGLEAAFVYGSWAARRLGEPGPFPRTSTCCWSGTSHGVRQRACRRRRRPRCGATSTSPSSPPPSGSGLRPVS